jgi:hypothetical protein
VRSREETCREIIAIWIAASLHIRACEKGGGGECPTREGRIHSRADSEAKVPLPSARCHTPPCK